MEAVGVGVSKHGKNIGPSTLFDFMDLQDEEAHNQINENQNKSIPKSFAKARNVAHVDSKGRILEPVAELIYRADGDSNGLIVWLGTSGGTQSFINPMDAGDHRLNAFASR